MYSFRHIDWSTKSYVRWKNEIRHVSEMWINVSLDKSMHWKDFPSSISMKDFVFWFINCLYPLISITVLFLGSFVAREILISWKNNKTSSVENLLEDRNFELQPVYHIWCMCTEWIKGFRESLNYLFRQTSLEYDVRDPYHSKRPKFYTFFNFHIPYSKLNYKIILAFECMSSNTVLWHDCTPYEIPFISLPFTYSQTLGHMAMFICWM